MRRQRFLLLAAVLGVVGVGLTLRDALALLPAGEWLDLVTREPATTAEVTARHAFAPRIAVALFAGAGLAIAGALLQQALRNPLADPTTVGASAGAGLALAAATLFAPDLLYAGREAVAVAGATLATLAVAGAAARDRFSPVTLILAGLVVTLTAGAASSMLLTLSTDYVGELFVWQSGSLIQNGDAGARALTVRIALAALAAALLVRPLGLLDLDDAAAGSLGVSPNAVRLAALAVAVALTGAVAAYVGVIGFVGLAAPAFARWTGARSFAERLARAPVIGALLLLAVDRATAYLAPGGAFPTGVATALLGAPLLLLLLPSMRRTPPAAAAGRVARRPWRHMPTVLALLLPAALAVALVLGPTASGWRILWGEDFDLLAPFRLPRVAVAASCGVLLAVAGVVMQRVTGNPIASPEALGVSAGATLGVLAALLATSGVDRALLTSAAATGAAAALAIGAAIAGRRLAADRLLLAGFSLAALASAASALALSLGDPRTQWMLTWLSGSTYRATSTDAMATAPAAIVALGAGIVAARWLDILPLGAATSSSIGLRANRAAGAMLVGAAICTAVATLAIGPLSFVGLVAPHAARLAGFRRARPHLVAASAMGAILLVVADWLGRSTIYPWQIPAGTITALLGGGYLLLVFMASSASSSSAIASR